MLVALGGNAMTAADGSVSAEDQRQAISRACVPLAELVEAGHEVVITHGNGPQVGNILRKNELAAGELPPVSLDWCGAQTQGTLGFTIVNQLEKELHRRGLERRGLGRRVVALVTRTRVDPADPAFANPVKPIGQYRDAEYAQSMSTHGQHWRDVGAKGWRRVVPSPAPVEVLETETITHLVDQGWLVVAAGGGGIPVIADDGGVRGVEAVIDKDLTAARLARSVGAEVLVIATDVDHAVVGYGTADERPIERIDPEALQTLVEEGHFASGSMGPKVQAILQFVVEGGTRGVITSLHRLAEGVAGDVGTVVSAAAAGTSSGQEGGVR
ncbi:carbamate kinase [Brevibacterium daeguense]|uniref:Carbamate kinase n=1 Tax=Brevibacterium daeguense TaxID=909936 RepID=A0ABP8EHB6_9MICO